MEATEEAWREALLSLDQHVPRSCSEGGANVERERKDAAGQPQVQGPVQEPD